jgi:type I restriction enzyme, S subunit
MLNFPKYESYKDSGVEWLGEIPEHWDLIKVSHSFKLIGSGTTPQSGQGKYYEDGQIHWVNTGDLNDGILESTAKCLTRKALKDHSTLKIYPPNTVLMAMYGATIGKTSILNLEACTNQACCALGNSIFHRPKFIFYWLIGNRKIIISKGYGGGQPNISQEVIKSLRVSTPSLSEQDRIIDFLDRKTAEIDQAIARKQRLIELLKEQKAILIDRAVTKGLDSNSSNQDSGIEWIGDIPDTWKIKKLKYVSPKQSVGLVINPSTYVVEEGIPFLFGGNILEGKISLKNVRHISSKSNKVLSSSRLNANDLVTVRVGYPGITSVVPTELDGCNCASVMIIRSSPKFISQWLCYCMNSRIVRSQVEIVQYGAAQKQFNISHAVNFILPCPPIEDQKKITDFLDVMEIEFQEVFIKIEQEIVLLSRLKSILISEAVTGKIKIQEDLDV